MGIAHLDLRRLVEHLRLISVFELTLPMQFTSEFEADGKAQGDILVIGRVNFVNIYRVWSLLFSSHLEIVFGDAFCSTDSHYLFEIGPLR